MPLLLARIDDALQFPRIFGERGGGEDEPVGKSPRSPSRFPLCNMLRFFVVAQRRAPRRGTSGETSRTPTAAWSSCGARTCSRSSERAKCTNAGGQWGFHLPLPLFYLSFLPLPHPYTFLALWGPKHSGWPSFIAWVTQVVDVLKRTPG